MAIVLLSLTVIIKILPCLVLKKKKVESFSFEDRIVPVGHMTSVSLSKCPVIWIDHRNSHKREHIA